MVDENVHHNWSFWMGIIRSYSSVYGGEWVVHDGVVVVIGGGGCVVTLGAD